MHGAALVLIAAILWGTTGTAQALGPEAATPLGVGTLRLVVGGMVLGAIAIGGRRSRTLAWLVTPATAFAAAGMAAYQPAFFSAVERTGVAVGTVVTIGSAPMFVGVIETALTGVPPPRRWFVATAPAILGLATLGLASGGVEVDGLGIALAAAAGFSYATYTVAAARLAPRGPAHESAGVVFMLAAVLLLPVAVGQNLTWATSDRGVVMIGWLGIAATAASYLLFTTGLRTTGAGPAATLSLAEPVTATLLGVVILSERPDEFAWAGVALIAIGLTLTAVPARRDPRPAPP